MKSFGSHLPAPKMFTIIWNLMKSFLSAATLDKIKIFGCDSNEWKSALLEEIDADQLPVIYGGTMTGPDGDPRCLHLVITTIYDHTA